MKRLLLLATFLMGSASAASLSTIKASDLCFPTTMVVVYITKNGDSLSNVKMPVQHQTALKNLGIVVNDVDYCPYNLFVKFSITEPSKSSANRSYFSSQIGIISMPNEDGNIETNIRYVSQNSFTAASKDASISSVVSKYMSYPFESFLKDWQATHK